VRHQLLARAHASTCGEADNLARQTRVHHAENRRFPRSRRATPYLPRDRLGIPTPPRVVAERSYSYCEAGLPIRLMPADRSKPVPADQVRPRGTRGDGTPSGGSLTCPEYSSSGGVGRGNRAVPSRPHPGSRAAFTVLDTAGTGHPGCARGAAVVRPGLCRLLSLFWRGFDLIRDHPRVVGYVEGGRRCPQVSTLDSRG
jgi:hypothetical protein